MRDRPYPPDFVSRETLAYRLDMTIGALEQYLKRGLLPPPVKIGEALRWNWDDVVKRLASRTATVDTAVDPYDVDGAGNGKDQASATCVHGAGKGPGILLFAKASRHR